MSEGLEIAIVGMSCRFPGAENVAAFWRNLRDGVESLTVLGDAEIAKVPAEIRRMRSYVRVARGIPGVDEFEAAFFGVSPREAEIMDPQHRLFLECCWTALEDAGYDPERYPGTVGVYAGSRLGTYLMNVYSNPALVRAVGDLQVQVSNDKDYLATRVSYKLDLGGPSVTVQTACSTSLVAVHLACQGLLSGECDMALAGGVALRIPEIGYFSNEGDVNSPDGHVRSFDAKAAGTVFGSGLGAVVLKRLGDALADGDTIHAVVKGSAVTNDGAQKVGFTAPGVDGQVRVLRAALTAAEVDPATIGYVEAHGTGTQVGDPIEVAALAKVFRERTSANGFCALASVKSNIGHLGAAAGVAGLIKAALALENRAIPPSLLFETPNPQIDFASSPFYVATSLREWPANGTPRRAGVSAFGMGGTNAHVVLEEAPPAAPAAASRPWQLLLLSTRTETALATATANLAAHLETVADDDLADVAWTLQVGRKVHEHRRAAVCRGAGHARQVLAGADPEWAATGFTPARGTKVAFLFSGQGAQYAGMGRGLYAAEPAFREQIDLCSERLQGPLGLDLRELLFAADDDAGAAERLAQTRFTQPALFAVEYALARLWMAWGVVPQAMLGHSIGEYVAACLAGVMSLADALALVAERGRLMQALPAGAMLAVPLGEAELVPLLDGQLSLAAVNAPGRAVVSGPHEAVEALRMALAGRGVAARPLHTSHAFHSGMMEPALAPFLERFRDVALRPPAIPYVSNVSGTWITAEEATNPGYWARHLRLAVRFADGVRELCRDPRMALLEVGPGQTLTTLARQHPDRGAGRAILASLRRAKDRREDLPVLLKTLGELWLAGVEPDWSGFHAGARRRRVPLPTYPFERRRFWIEPGTGDAAGFGIVMAPEALKKQDVADWFYLPYWKPSLPPVPTAEDAARAGRWLVFLDEEGGGDLGARVLARLAAAGRRVVTVEPGDGFRQVAERRYEVAPGSRDDYDALVKALAAAGDLPDSLLHLWNAGPVPDAVDAAEVAERSFWSLLHLAQALGRSNVAQPMRMAVASSHLHQVAGEVELLPERALLLGPSRVIPQEYTNVRCVSVDLPWPAGDADVARLIAEATVEPATQVVAYRQGYRWVRAYEAARLGPPAEGSLQLREGGVYLITGGLGGLGLTFAEFLAREHRARLVLLGVSALPDRAAWDEWLRTHGSAERISQRIAKLRAIEALGAEVVVASADVADREQMRRVVAQALSRFGRLDGVIHAAGVAGGGLIQLKTREAAGRVLAPKLEGTRALAAALEGVELDFLVLCSSTIGVAGGLGQVDYCAANSFLDTFAHAAALSGGPRTISLNWGAWEQVGMAVASGITRGAAGPAQTELREEIHPLLDRCVSEMAEQSIYATRLSAERHWVLAEHRVMGTPTLPGTTYLELARAAFQHHATMFEGHPPDGGVELRDVLFLGPLLVPEGEREVQVVLDREGDAFGFRVAARIEAPAGRETAWRPHARGKVAGLAEPPARERWDLGELRARCAQRVFEISGPIMSSGEGLVYWGAHWQSLRRVDLGRGEALAEIELPADLAAEAGSFGLHPALLDVATGILGFYEEESYLPLSYRRVRVHRPLPARFYSYLRQQGEPGAGGETLAVDIVLLDGDGHVLVEIEHFAMKRVGEAVETLRRGADATAAAAETPAEAPVAAAASAAAAPVEAAADGILPHEGVEALRRALSRDLDVPQLVVTAKDLHAMIAQVNSFNRSSIMDAAGDGALARSAHERPSLPTPYAAPATAAQRCLAEIWQVALGIDRVGVNDNFFDLGGDSIVGIQLIARANEAGLQLSPDQLFEHQTIAELARIVAADEEEPAAAAPLPVTLFQRELLAAGTGAPCWYAAWPLPAAGGLTPADLVAQALAVVTARHEALRTRFTRAAEGWSQVAVPAQPVPLREVTLPSGAPAERQAAIVDLVAALRAQLAPESGVALAAAVLSGADGERTDALVVAHAAATDAAGWRLLREEVATACRQLAAGADVELPAVTSSFGQWLAARRERALAEPPPAGGEGWPAERGTAAAAATTPPPSPVTVRLAGEDAAALLEEIPAAQRLRVEELLLAATAATLGAGRSPASIAVEVDGREAEPLNLDLTRTVGCFTVVALVDVELSPAGAPGEHLRALKEELRSALARGLAAARRRDVAADPAPASPAAVRFGYLADSEARREEGADLGGVSVRAQREAEGLRLEWRGDLAGRPAETLALELHERLRRLIAAGRASTLAAFAPSDFPDAGLSQEDLDRLLSQGAA
jgi:acyl transferase domain-containing protein